MHKSPNYTSILGTRSTEYFEAEKTAQTRFDKICTVTYTRLNDASKKDSDMAAFNAQSQYMTLRQYVWHEVSATIA